MPIASTPKQAQSESNLVNQNDRATWNAWEVLFANEYIFDNIDRCYLLEKVVPRYMASIQKSTLNSGMRRILVDWMIDVSIECQFSKESCHLSVHILDRVLSQVQVMPNEFQKFGATCLLIASKFYEPAPLSVSDCSFLTDNSCSVHDIRNCETYIMNLLSFNVMGICNLHFLDYFLKAAIIPKDKVQQVQNMANLFSDLSLEYYELSSYLPSQIASSCIILSLYICGLSHWDSHLSSITRYKGHTLEPCLRDIIQIYDNFQSSSEEAIKTRYKSMMTNDLRDKLHKFPFESLVLTVSNFRTLLYENKKFYDIQFGFT